MKTHTTITFINRKTERRQATEQEYPFLNLELCTTFLEVTDVYFPVFHEL